MRVSTTSEQGPVASSYLLYCLSVLWYVSKRLPQNWFSLNLVMRSFTNFFLRNSKFGQTRPKILGTLHEDISTFTLFSIECGRRAHINREKRLLTSPCPTVCLSVFLSAYLRSAPAGNIFVKFDTGDFYYENLSKNSKFG